MPQGANAVIKKNDDTTDVTYTFVQPAAGEGSHAIWTGPMLGNSLDHQAQLRLSSRAGSNGTTRVVRGTYVFPDVQGASAPYTIAARGRMTVEFSFPTGMASSSVYECVSQFFNLLDHTAIKDCFKTGYAAS